MPQDVAGPGVTSAGAGWQEGEVDVAGPSASSRKKFSRLAWGLEIYDLLSGAIEQIYEPELQVIKS